ncbi:acyltransferase [uncultured Alistipes sp.]|uniref:acyltransferase family protein n=2 Tax=Alistipes sp. TaxID=1872444 RepID=UPI00266C2E3B|nr:acyltransferase family protein [uncultured Alistipes sp.]
MNSATADCNRRTAPRDPSLDVARALSMVYIIVLWHLLSYTGAFSFVPYGGEYITSVFLGLFFIISGYLLKSKYDITGRAALKKYLTRRVLRIMPIYAVALASFVMVAMCTPREALFAFLGLSSFIPPQPMTLWFVSMILFFYVCFLVSGLRCKYVVWTAVYALIIVASHFYDGIDPRLILYFPCFIFGIFLQKIGRTEQLTKGGGTLFVLSVLALLLIESPAPALDRLLTICLAISASVLLLSLSERAARIKGVNVAAGFIAYSSLVAYMFHRQLMMVFIHFYWPGSSNGRLIYVLLICAPAVILFGYAGQKIYDLTLNFLLGLGQRRSPGIPSATDRQA